MDSASEARLSEVYPDLAVRWRRVAEDVWSAHRIRLRVTDGIRSMEDQSNRFAQGRTTSGEIVTYARPGESWHLYGLAIDSCFQGPDPYLEQDPRAEMLWREYGRIATAHGLTWGGAWSRRIDRPHVQMTYGLSLQQVKDLYSYRGNDSVWAKCDQMRGVAVGTDWRPMSLG